MMLTDLHSAFDRIKTDFDALITCKERGSTLEIVTNLVTLDQSFVSVFLSQQAGRFIVSDGGWLHTGEYDHEPVNEAALLRYQQRFNLLTTTSPVQVRYFYAAADKPELVSARVHDVAHFVQAVVNHGLVMAGIQ